MKSKKNSYGGMIFAILFFSFLVLLITVKIVSDRTVMSTSIRQGNSAGNLYNLGLFCTDGDRVYFSNQNDQGMLYSMSRDYTDFKKLSTDCVRYINCDDNYIFYSRNNNLKDKAARSIFVFYSNGIYRINKKGKNLTMLWNEPIGSMVLYRNRVLYQRYTEGRKLTINSVGIDGKSDIELVSDDSPAVSINNGKLYFAGIRNDKKLHSVSLDSASSKVEADGCFYNPIVHNGFVYYINTDKKYKLCCSDLNGDNVSVLVSDKVSSYNFSDDFRYLYYQKDGSNDNGLFVLDMNSFESKNIMKGDFKWLNVVGNDCFFTKFDDTDSYVYSPDKGISLFDPPVVDD